MELLLFALIAGAIWAGGSNLIGRRSGGISEQLDNMGSSSLDPTLDVSADPFSDADSAIHSTDIYTDPAYSSIPGNIYHSAFEPATREPDIITDPEYSYLSCNIYHHREDDWNTCSGFDSSTFFRMDD